MGQARDVMDRLTTAITTKDTEALKACYAAGAVTRTPDQGEISGRDAICNYFLEFFEAFPDEAGREAHLTGKGAALLMERSNTVLVRPAQIDRLDVLMRKGEAASVIPMDGASNLAGER